MHVNIGISNAYASTPIPHTNTPHSPGIFVHGNMGIGVVFEVRVLFIRISPEGTKLALQFSGMRAHYLMPKVLLIELEKCHVSMFRLDNNRLQE